MHMKLSTVQTEEYRNYPRRTYVSATLLTTKLTRSGLRPSPHLHRTRPATNHLRRRRRRRRRRSRRRRRRRRRRR
jgi:hypothetical protein